MRVLISLSSLSLEGYHGDLDQKMATVEYCDKRRA